MGSMQRVVIFLLLLAIPSMAFGAGAHFNTPVTISNTINHFNDGGATDTYAGSLNGEGFAGAAYVEGACVTFTANTANTGAATLNVNAIGAAAIKKMVSGAATDLATNDICVDQHVRVCFVTDYWQMTSPTCNVASGGVSDGDKGDITVSASGATYTIDNDVVTYDKMQNVSATDRLLGRDTAGAGNVEELDATAVRAMLAVPQTSLTLTVAGTTNEIASSAGAQDLTANRTWTLSLPASLDLGAKAVEIPNSATLPATCTVGQMYMDTDATSGQRFYLCQATDTWAVQGDGGGAGVTDGDKGDITVSSTGTVWTIDNNAVTLAKMADIATDSFLGRDTAGTGDPEVLSVATTKTVLALNNVDNTSDATKNAAAVTLTNKTITLPTMTILDNALTIQDNADPTKQAQIMAGGITTGTTRTYTLFNASDTFVCLACAQTLTTKTLDLASNTVSGTLAQFNTAVSDANLVPEARTLTAGFGIQTLGDLSANRTVAMEAAAADDQVYVSDSTSDGTWRAVPNCTDTSGQHLNYTAATNSFSCGTTGDGVGGGAGTPIALSHATGTVNALACSTVELYYRHDMSGAITIPAFTGTCTDGQKVTFRLKPDTGGALGLTFNTGTSKAFSAENGLPLPTTTFDSTMYVEYAFMYNATSDRFGYLGGTKATAPLGLADGGTNAALTDPGAHRLWGWDDTDNVIKFWTLGGGLTYTQATATVDVSTNIAKLDTANSWADGVKQTFNPNGTTAGVNVGSQAGDPSTPANGDLWYDSTANELTARINGANVALGAAGAGVSDGDKGDITVSSSGTVWTIDNNVVTLAKMATMATDSFLGRDTAATGDVEVLSAATARTVLDVDAYTGTFTNKTYDAEGTGNVFTSTSKIWLEAAGCQNATASLMWDTPTTNPAVAACVTGTNTQKGVADFADGGNLSMQRTIHLPSDFTGALDAKIKWFSATASTNNVVWQLATICVADAETDDPAFNTASTVTDAGKGTTLQTNDATITGVTTTGCAAGELMHIRIQRDSGHASDNFAGTARLIGLELTMRRAQ